MKKVEESSQKSAYLYAIKLLAKRDYSVHKLTKKLKDRGHDQEHVDEAIQEVLDLGYLKEELYVEARVKGLMHKGLHPNFIQMKLKEEYIKIEDQLIYDIFAEYPITIEDQIHKLLTKKLPRDCDFHELDFESKQKIKQRAYRYALSKGHQYGPIQTIFTQITNSDQ